MTPLRISCVSFFNTTPLVYGLQHDASLRLRFGVPSSLLDDLKFNRADVALLPVIDYQHAPGLQIIPSGGIGCDGATLTVRLFSRSPIEQTTTLAADTDSHTSVALARVIFKNCYGLSPRVVPLNEASADDTLLLIGDKVITHPPVDKPVHLDLGYAWKQLTGLPFVFAVWTARAGVTLGDLPRKLSDARAAGLAHIDELVETQAVPHGWPADVARQYLTDYLRFDIGARQLEAIARFHTLAYECGVFDHAPYPLRIASPM